MILNSPFITGSITVTNNIVASGSLTVLGTINGAVTGSVDSASYAAFAATANSASYALTSTSGSYAFAATSASQASNANTATSSSFANTAISASQSSNANTAISASQASNANTATSASQAANAVTSSYAANADLLDGIDSTRFAVTSSNTFTGTQYISAANNAISFTSTASVYTDGGLRVTKDAYVSGTIYVNNLTVYGTQSINYITSSQLNIGTNIITVNTDTPAIRFGGLAVYDSGSTGLTGSMLWDSEDNHWVYSNPSGSSYDGGMMLSGPRNSSGLGNEQGVNNNAILKGQGGDHVTSSLITETGTATTFYTNALYVTSSNFVGVGTTSPSYSLDINGTTTTALRLTDSGDVGFQMTSGGSNNAFSIRTNGSAVVMSTSNSYPLSIGVNTSSGSVLGSTTGLTIASGGAATFASNVTSNGNIISNGGVIAPLNGGSIEVYNSGNSNYFDLKSVGGNFALRTRVGTGAVNALTIEAAGAATFSSTLQAGAITSSVTTGNGSFYINNASLTNKNWTLIPSTSGAETDLLFFYTGTGAGTRMTLTNGGNVGIGTTSPQSLFDVTNVVNTAYTSVNTLVSGQTMRIANTSTTSGVSANLLFIATGAGAGNGLGSISGVNTGTGSLALTFATRDSGGNVTERVRIASGGNVGIGTDSPVSALNVSGTTGLTWAANGVSSGLVTIGTPLTGGSLFVNTVSDGGSGYQSGLGVDGSSGSQISTINIKAFGVRFGGFWGSNLAFHVTNGTSLNEAMRITQTGNIGIGTTSPSYRLDVVRGSSGVVLNLEGENAYNAETGILMSSSRAKISGFLNGSGGTPGASLRFYTMPDGGSVTERIRIDSNGNVGIGTTSPSYKLDVNGNARYQFRNASNEIMDLAITTSQAASTSNISLLWYGSETASLRFIRGDDSTGGNIAFWTQPTGGSITERMRITSGGRVGIGVSSPGAALQVAQPGVDDQLILGSTANNRDHAMFMCSGPNQAEILRYQSGVRLIFASSTSISNVDVLPGGSVGVRLGAGNTSWSAFTSDARRKKNFETVPGLDAVMQIEPVKYHFNTQDDSEIKKLGFTAQNIQPLIPEMVHTNGEKEADGSDTLTIIPDYILPVLVKAIQEQQAQIEELKAEIDILKSK
jgi:hypothetical protein